MPINPERAPLRYERNGNDLYKKGALNKAIAAYKEAASLDPLDPYPLSNLSAAYFEAGSYADSVKAAREALEKAELTADTQSSTAQKFLIRSVESWLCLSRADEAEQLVNKILPGKELDGLLYALRDAKDPQPRLSVLREKLFQLPHVRPSVQDELDYFGPGHDVAESLFTRKLELSCLNDPVLNFMLCGKAHFTILDHKPAVLVRILIFFYIMQEGATSITDHRDANTGLLSVSYIFCAQLMPPYVADKFYYAAERVECRLKNGENPFGFIHIPTSQMKGLAVIIHRWRHNAKKMFLTAQTGRNIGLDVARPSLPPAMPGAKWGHMAECEVEHRFFDDFSVMFPPAGAMALAEPELADLVAQYHAENGPAVRRKIADYLDRHWSINPTLIDFEWEANKEEQGPPALGFDPFVIVECMTNKTQRGKKKVPEAISFVTNFFGPTLIAIRDFQDELMIEVVVGEMLNSLERIRYECLERPDPKSPKKYHVIHMSNIPHVHFPSNLLRAFIDYVGGALASFLYAAPLLKQGKGTGLTSNVLRNPPQWKNVGQFNAEYLLMHDRLLIQKHCSVKLTPLMPAATFDFLIMSEYHMWQSVGRRKLAFYERMPREMLFRWPYSHFLKLCLPFPRPTFDMSLVYAPLNMTVFMRLLDLVAELGYPGHWISSIVSAVASGEITTTARAPRKYVLKPGAIDQTYDPRTISVRPWVDEFTTLAAMWRGAWPSCTLVLMKESLPPLGSIGEYSIRFPDITGKDLGFPHFAPVLWNRRKYGDPPRNLYRLLLDDGEKGDLTSSARAIRADDVKAPSTFTWTRKTSTAGFWLRSDAVDEMSANGWVVYIWRVDVWVSLTGGISHDGAITRKGSFGTGLTIP
ncbi:hypothetical protein F5Y19DRAFT_481085 [Xylariaceae sp. FL1651]|nr:hypothetical protein F5Y19DRAFT_481085 [Xylariaceae sp. FL1651]